MAEALPEKAGPPAPGPSQPSDEQALAAYLRGDKAMVAELVRRYERPLFGLLIRLTGRPADAADLFQETFLRVMQHADSFAGESRFKTWLYSVAINVSRMHRRGALRHPAEPLDAAPPPAVRDPGPDGGAERSEIGARVAEAVERLPEAQREVLVMKVYDDMNYREIAAALGRPVSTVKSQMRLALERLRGVLHGLGRDYGAA